MILDKYIDIKINPRNKTYYKNKGYDIEKKQMIKSIISVKIEDLHPGSTAKINVKCDNCGYIRNMEYRHYIANLKKYDTYYCNKCKYKKSKITKLEKYGDENYTNKEKYINTMLERYGVEYPMQSSIIFEKIINTKLEKYGDENYNNYKQISNTKKIRYGDAFFNNKIKNKETINKHLYKKIPNLISIDDTNNKLTILCDKCDKEYTIYRTNYNDRNQRNRVICTNCNPLKQKKSSAEIYLSEYIKTIYKGEIITSDRKIIAPYEIDIYLPEISLGFEFNSLYWHNELHKDKNYHSFKTTLCNNKNIDLFHIYEDDWIYRNNIIKSMILYKLKLINNKIFARKTEIKIISDVSFVDDFYNENHLQGKSTYSINIGLSYENNIISIMSFKKNKDNIELVRFANKLNINIIGGASKLFKYFLKNYDFEKIISFSNNDYSNGRLYEILNFKKDKELEPDYSYIYDNIRKHKFNFRKHNLSNMGFDIKNKSEHDICLENNIYRIYDSGKIRWVY